MDMPIKFKSGASIGPVALACFTIAFLALLASVILIILYADANKVEFLVKPLLPALAAIGSAALLWFKLHLNQKASSEQNSEIATTVNTRLNGELDARIRKGVTEAVNALNLVDRTAQAAADAQAHPAHAAAPVTTAQTGS